MDFNKIQFTSTPITNYSISVQRFIKKIVSLQLKTSSKHQIKKLLTRRHGDPTISVWLQSFSSRRGRCADHAGKNRTSIARSYQKLWPLEVSASQLSIFGQKLR